MFKFNRGLKEKTPKTKICKILLWYTNNVIVTPMQKATFQLPCMLFAVPVCVQWPEAALRGVAAIQRGRARAAYPTAAAAAAAAAAFARPPLAGALHGYTPVLNTLPVEGGVYYDPFLTAHAADPNYRLQVRAITGNAKPV